jgi:hypothetical protein
MSCRKGWSREVLTNNFTYKFVSKTYKERRENLLYERERSMMPATEIYVEFEKEYRRISKIIEKLSIKYGRAVQEREKIRNKHLNVIADEHNLTDAFDSMVMRLKLTQEQEKIVKSLEIDLTTQKTIQTHIQNRLSGTTIQPEKRAFVRACPAGNCKGFLSTAWKCGLCENWTCPTCHEIKGLEKDVAHTCSPENVATAELLARDSRNCPNCASMIFQD